MSIQLLIHDGNPYWYLSPDIWVVPGNDPTASPGPPIAGKSAYLWARVTNNGTEPANQTRIDFYWANPALQVTRSNATLVGSAFADVDAGSSHDVLCLVPWFPVIVNGGHECLIAVANHPSDPLPNPLPDAFDPTTYRQIAQKNLSVAVASSTMSVHTITINGLLRADKVVNVVLEMGGELDDISLTRLGISGLSPSRENRTEVALTTRREELNERAFHGNKKFEIRVPKGTSAPLYLAIKDKNLAKDEYQFINITELAGERVIGGLGFVIVPEEKEK